MTAPNHPYGEQGSTRVGQGTPPSGTHAGADVTSRMTGQQGQHAAPAPVAHGPGDQQLGTARPAERGYTGKIKTSAAATFALVFGLAALFCALTAILAPVAVVLGLIGLLLSFSGFKMARRPGVTGKGVAAGGLVTSVLALLLGLGVIVGAAVFVNDERRLDQLQGWIDDARNNLPSGGEVVEQVPGN